jgi:hypothetical protein
MAGRDGNVNAPVQNILGLKQISASAILRDEQPTMGGLLHRPKPAFPRHPGGVAGQARTVASTSSGKQEG